MSGGRRKSKHPQKWEDIQDEISNTFDSSATESFSNHKILQETSCPMNSTQISKSNDNRNTSNLHQSQSAHPKKSIGNNEGGMTVLDVFQGFRQGLVGECKACSIQLKDWNSTVNHIRSHRLVYIPLCAREGGMASNNRSATCFLCKKVCQNVSVLAFHAHTEHSLTQAPFICPFCGRVFSSSSLIQKHIDIRDVCMKCPVCSATYDQEYKLYSHLSNCLPTFHPHLKNLTCHVCRDHIGMEFLADHMISHTIQGHEVRQIKPRRKSEGSFQRNKGSHNLEEAKYRTFLCEICDQRFTSFDDFRSHLFEHTETKMYCPLCFLKGFERMDFIVRHLMLRCPRRSIKQNEFGSFIYHVGKKKQKLNFLQVVREINNLEPFREGLRAWTSVPLVVELISSINSLRKEDLTGLSCPNDIDLLAWLSDFEKKIKKIRKDSMALNAEIKKNICKTNGDLECSQMSEGTSENFEALNVMNMKSGPEGNPLEANDYSGAILIHDVEIGRLKVLHDEANALIEKDYLEEHIENGTYTKKDFVQLEWEAQYIRFKEPFYFPVIKEKRELSPLYRNNDVSVVGSLESSDPQTLERIKEELQELGKMTGISMDNQN